MRVRIDEIGSMMPLPMRKLGLGDVGIVLGPTCRSAEIEHVGAELLGVVRCQATMAGTRLSVRGET
jgi:hypothetical protein